MLIILSNWPTGFWSFLLLDRDRSRICHCFPKEDDDFWEQYEQREFDSFPWWKALIAGYFKQDIHHAQVTHVAMWNIGYYSINSFLDLQNNQRRWRCIAIITPKLTLSFSGWKRNHRLAKTKCPYNYKTTNTHSLILISFNSVICVIFGNRFGADVIPY